MLGLTGLHALAAPRGDGLRQELLELFTQRQQLAAANVEDIFVHLAEHFVQAGPNPVPPSIDADASGVLIFPTREAMADSRPTVPRLRRER